MIGDKDIFISDREWEMNNMSDEEQAQYVKMATESQENYLLSLIETSSFRNTEEHAAFEREIIKGITDERFNELLSLFEQNQVDPVTLGMANQTDINKHLKNL